MQAAGLFVVSAADARAAGVAGVREEARLLMALLPTLLAGLPQGQLARGGAVCGALLGVGARAGKGAWRPRMRRGAASMACGVPLWVVHLWCGGGTMAEAVPRQHGVGSH